GGGVAQVAEKRLEALPEYATSRSFPYPTMWKVATPEESAFADDPVDSLTRAPSTGLPTRSTAWIRIVIVRPPRTLLLGILGESDATPFFGPSTTTRPTAVPRRSAVSTNTSPVLA